MAWILSKEILNITPSRLDGINPEVEKAYRNKSCSLIEDLGFMLSNPHAKILAANARLIISSACVLFHRFYAFQSFKSHDRMVMAVTCLFLACKIEDSYVKVDTLVDFYVKHEKLKKEQSKEKEISTPFSAEDIIELRRKVIIAERVLLHSVGFELQIEHPYDFVRKEMSSIKNYIPESLRKDVYQQAVNFINDSFRTTLCLQYTQHDMALTSIFLALLGSKAIPIPLTSPSSSSKLPVSKSWLQIILEVPNVHDNKIFLSEESLRDMCEQIMSIFEFKKLSDSYVTRLKLIQSEVFTTFGSGRGKSNELNSNNDKIGNAKIYDVAIDDVDSNPSKRQKMSPISS